MSRKYSENNRSKREKVNAFGFTTCESPICCNKIWSDGYKFGNGKYCDKYCKDDAIFFYNRSPEGRAVIEKRAESLRVSNLKKRGVKSIGDYKFEFNK